MNTHKNLTIKDIAKLANVSHATVSRVLTNADYPVSRELREKILRIAKENHYTPNISGRLLKQAHSSDVGILIPDYTNLYYTTIIAAMDKRLSDLGVDLLIMRTGSSPEAEISAVERMLARRVCALILTEKPHDEETVDRILEKGVIPILINSSFEKAGCISIHMDTEQSSLLVAEHLAKQGHSCAAFINSHITKENSYRDGILSAFQQYGIRCVEMYPNKIKDSKEPQHGFSVGQETAEYLSEQAPDATAYVCSNDMAAAGALSALQKKGIRVPEDIAVIGRDNVLISRISYPAITTLEEPYEEIAEYAVSVIRDGIEKTGFVSPVKIKPRLIIRASSEKSK